MALTVSVCPAAAQTGSPSQPLPPGFYSLDAAPGIELYRKDYSNGSPDFVQLVDLSLGAHLELLHGEITEPRPTKGDWGGPDPRLTALPIQTYWEQAKQKDPHVFCLTNGTFYYMPEYPTRLAFPLKVHGELVAGGWGSRTYEGEHLMLELWADHAEIEELTTTALAASTAPDIIGGLTEEANKKAKFSVGRTFVGIKDRDRDGLNETVLIYNTLTAVQSGAADVLRDFGAAQVMMLDGGGSTQLLCRSGSYIESDRPLPQMIASVAASQPPVKSDPVQFTDWAVVVEGEQLPFEIVVRNSGAVTWTHATTTFLLQSGQLGLTEQQPLLQDVPPGETAVISQTINLFKKSGLLTTELAVGLRYYSREYPQGSLTMHVVVLPFALRERKPELEQLLSTWLKERPEQAASLARSWIAAQQQTSIPIAEWKSQEPIKPLDAALVPLLMLPFMLLIAWGIAHGKR